MTTNEMFTIWYYRNAKAPLCYCETLSQAETVAEVLECRMDVFIAAPNVQLTAANFGADASGIEKFNEKHKETNT